MAENETAKTVAGELTRGITTETIDQMRQIAGLKRLPADSLADALAELGFTVEDLATLLMATLVEKSRLANNQAKEIDRLNDLCRTQLIAMDQILDQAALLGSKLKALGLNAPTKDPMEQLVALTERPSR